NAGDDGFVWRRQLGAKGSAKAPAQNPRGRGPKIRPRTLKPKLGNVETEFVDDDGAVVAHLFYTGRNPGLIQRLFRASRLGLRLQRSTGVGVRCFPDQTALVDTCRVERLSPHGLRKRLYGQGCRAGQADIGLEAAQRVTREQRIRAYGDDGSVGV